MKVLAINSSPRGPSESKTEMLLTPLVEGMREAGAQVEVVRLREKTVRHCVGCFTCWTKTPGVCVHKDDMSREIFPAWLNADIAVYATPLYHYTLNASLKAFIERTLPALDPLFEQDEDGTGHPYRQAPPKIVVLSVAGFPEMPVFDQLSAYARSLFRETLLAEIYRPAAEGLAYLPETGVRADILAALRQAGGELVRSGQVAPQTMARITQPLGLEAAFAQIGNLTWKTCLREGITPREMRERGIPPRPDSVETFLLLLPKGFRPDKAAGLAATIQFDFTGEAEGSCHFRIADGALTPAAGPADKPDLVIRTPFELWMDIMAGKANGGTAFLARKYTAEGDLSLLMRLSQLFGRD